MTRFILYHWNLLQADIQVQVNNYYEGQVEMEQGKEEPGEKDKISLLTTGEVARLLQIHINTVRNWSNLGVLTSIRIGPRNDRRFREKDILTFLERTRNEKIDSESNEQAAHN